MKAIIISIFVALIIVVGVLISGPANIQNGISTTTQYPAPTGFVVDNANVLSINTKNSLTALLKNYKDAEIAVLTIPTTNGIDITEYGVGLADYWGVGNDRLDNGIILIVAIEDRQVRIEVGTGFEALITDATAGKILDNYVIPSLKEENWDEGVERGVNALIETINQGVK